MKLPFGMGKVQYWTGRRHAARWRIAPYVKFRRGCAGASIRSHRGLGTHFFDSLPLLWSARSVTQVFLLALESKDISIISND